MTSVVNINSCKIGASHKDNTLLQVVILIQYILHIILYLILISATTQYAA